MQIQSWSRWNVYANSYCLHSVQNSTVGDLHKKGLLIINRMCLNRRNLPPLEYNDDIFSLDNVVLLPKWTYFFLDERRHFHLIEDGSQRNNVHLQRNDLWVPPTEQHFHPRWTNGSTADSRSLSRRTADPLRKKFTLLWRKIKYPDCFSKL